MEWRRKAFSKFSLIPQRYVFAIMGFLATITVYLLRYSMVLTMYRMANSTHSSFVPNMNMEPCPNIRTANSTERNSTTSEEYTEIYPFDWNTSEQNRLLNGFFMGYIVTQYFGGLFSEMKGGKSILGGGILLSSICTIIIPYVAKYGIDAAYYVRIITGLGCGMSLPALMTMMSQWVPPHERARIGVIIYGGTYAGNVFGPHLAEFIMKIGRWDYVFYTFGIIGINWVGIWYSLCYSTPNVHPFISEKEKKFLNENVITLQRTSKPDLIPWKAYLRCVPFWATVVIFLGHEWGLQTLTIYMFQYISETYNYDVTSRLLLASLGYLAVTGSAVCLIIGIYAGCNEILGISMFILAMVNMGAFHCGAWINFLDITPSYAGTMLGIADNIAINVTKMMPKIFNLLAPQWTSQQFQTVFWLVFCLMLVTNIIFIIYGNGEQVWWDDVRKLGYPSNWKHGNLTTTTEIVINDGSKDELTTTRRGSDKD